MTFVRRYRLGATSFVYPASWLENVERLAGRVQDVEILFFDIDGQGDLPDDQELAALARCRVQHGLTYSLHTPLHASLASEDEARRSAGVQKVLHAIRVAQPLAPSAYVLHVYLGDREHDAPPGDLAAWRGRALRSFEELFEHGVARELCCVELIDYDLRLLDPVIEQLDLPVVLDIGHLHRDRQNLRDTVLHYLPRTKIIQWHGTDPSGRDHRSLEHFPQAEARWLLQALDSADYAGVLTLEVFRPEDFESSLRIVQDLFREVAA